MDLRRIDKDSKEVNGETISEIGNTLDTFEERILAKLDEFQQAESQGREELRSHMDKRFDELVSRIDNIIKVDSP